MIYECNYCGAFFNEPDFQHWYVQDPRGGLYGFYTETRSHCPFCGADDYDAYSSLLEYRGKYYYDEYHLKSRLRKLGYTDEEIKKALQEAIEIWEV